MEKFSVRSSRWGSDLFKLFLTKKGKYTDILRLTNTYAIAELNDAYALLSIPKKTSSNQKHKATHTRKYPNHRINIYIRERAGKQAATATTATAATAATAHR